MLKRIIVDCLICSALVAGGKIFSNVAEKNPKLKCPTVPLNSAT